MKTAMSTTSRSTLNRLPRYHSYLKTLLADGSDVVSSTQLSEKFSYDSSLIRKDFEALGIKGKPRIGFDIISAIAAIECRLGWQDVREAILVGTGRFGFLFDGKNVEVNGLRLLCGFDFQPQVIGRDNIEIEFFSIDRLPKLANRLEVKIGVLCTRADQAQLAAEIMIRGGIEAIWNFTSQELEVPKNIAVENVGLSASFAALTSKLGEAG